MFMDVSTKHSTSISHNAHSWFSLKKWWLCMSVWTQVIPMARNKKALSLMSVKWINNEAFKCTFATAQKEERDVSQYCMGPREIKNILTNQPIKSYLIIPRVFTSGHSLTSCRDFNKCHFLCPAVCTERKAGLASQQNCSFTFLTDAGQIKIDFCCKHRATLIISEVNSTTGCLQPLFFCLLAQQVNISCSQMMLLEGTLG